MIFLSAVSILLPALVCLIRVFYEYSTWDTYITNFNFVATITLGIVLVSSINFFFLRATEPIMLRIKTFTNWLIMCLIVVNVYSVYEAEGLYYIDVLSDLAWTVDIFFVVFSQLYILFGIYVYQNKHNPLFNFTNKNVSKTIQNKACITSGKIYIIGGLFSLYIPLKAIPGSYISFLALYIMIMILVTMFSFSFLNYITSEDYMSTQQNSNNF